MNIYKVVHHDSNQFEMSSTVIAHDMLEASKTVDGQVMHVELRQELRSNEPAVIGGSGWNMRFHTPNYKEPSEEWTEYLKSINLNQGLEDV